jgi:hypothetical protein
MAYAVIQVRPDYLTPVASPDDLDAVRRLLSQHYAKISARVVPSPLQMLRWDQTSE